jgi:hypothetical protein
MENDQNEAWPMETIYDPNGKPYISVVNQNGIFSIQLHQYTSRVVVTFDKAVIGPLVDALNRIKE